VIKNKIYSTTLSFCVIVLILNVGMISSITAEPITPIKSDDTKVVLFGIIWGEYIYFEKDDYFYNILCLNGDIKILGVCIGEPLITIQREFTYAIVRFFLGVASNGRIFGLVALCELDDWY